MPDAEVLVVMALVLSAQVFPFTHRCNFLLTKFSSVSELTVLRPTFLFSSGTEHEFYTYQFLGIQAILPQKLPMQAWLFHISAQPLGHVT